jgi:hypothetical protein
MSQAQVYLSYTKADQSWANKLASLLSGPGISVNKPKDFQDQLEGVLNSATCVVVLIGTQTRLSKWVDREIELSTDSRENGPAAGLVGVILPSHVDFSLPYYDPENIPLRLHDLVENEYAIIRKWSEDPDETHRWLQEAERRRHRFRPEPSLGTAAKLYRFTWDPEVD